MQISYHESLKKEYFGDLYKRVSNHLIKGGNVCVSGIKGFGRKTVLNFLYFNFVNDKIFNRIFIYDPELEDENIVNYTKNICVKSCSRGNLVIIRYFENIDEKPKILEKLDAIKRNISHKIVYLIFTDQEAVIHPSSHQAINSVFFSELIYLSPFTYKQTKNMIESMISYYGWKINPSCCLNIYKLSGGVPRLIKYLTKEVYESKLSLYDKSQLVLIPQIDFELRLMAKLVINCNASRLKLLGLTDKNGKLKSSLLKFYMAKFRSDIITTLYPFLGDNESRILSYFIENINQLVSLDKLADIMKMTDENFSLWAIYKIISRVKAKIKNNFSLKNIKGKGYLLQNNPVT